MNPTKIPSPELQHPQPNGAAPAEPTERQPYRAPRLLSTEAFERMALLSCGADASQPEECAEL